MPVLAVGGLHAGEHIDKALRVGAAEAAWGVRLRDVGVELVRIELREHISVGANG